MNNNDTPKTNAECTKTEKKTLKPPGLQDSLELTTLCRETIKPVNISKTSKAQSSLPKDLNIHQEANPLLSFHP